MSLAADFAHLAHACAIVSGEAALYAIGGTAYLAQLGTVQLFGFGAHAGDGEDLLVLLHALLQLAKQHAEA